MEKRDDEYYEACVEKIMGLREAERRAFWEGATRRTTGFIEYPKEEKEKPTAVQVWLGA